jgi:hypothetical protein
MSNSKSTTYALGDIIRDLPNKDYHSHSAISKSKLDVFRSRPLKYYLQYVSKKMERKPPTDAMIFGSYSHSVVLESPEETQKQYAFPAEKMRRGNKKWSAFCDMQEFESKNIICLPNPAWIETAHRIKLSIIAHPIASSLCGFSPFLEAIKLPEKEISFRTDNLPRFGNLRLQCKADILNFDKCKVCNEPYFVDLKSIDSLDKFSFQDFEKSFNNFGYHRQAAFYSAVVNTILGDGTINRFFFVVYETQEPFEVMVCEPSPKAFDAGYDEVASLLGQLADAFKEDDWFNNYGEIRQIDLPYSAYNKT